LARSGIGKLILVDNDTVSLSNINRQSIAYHSTVGRYKTQIMKERIADICSRIEVHTHETFVLQNQAESLITNDLDYIVDAIDTVTAKLAIAELALKRGIPLISSMGTGNKLHPELFEITDISKTEVCPLCKVMRRELKARGIYHLPVLYSKEKPIKVSLLKPEDKAEKKHSLPGSIAFVPPVAGLLIAGEVVRNLTKSHTLHDGVSQ
ncbi:MAG: tRNA threonylcarbamoyladenosine dehydratase, partial [Lachnospiraceae bacterium]